MAAEHRLWYHACRWPMCLMPPAVAAAAAQPHIYLPLTQKPCMESKPTTTRAWLTPLLLQVEEEKMPPP